MSGGLTAIFINAFSLVAFVQARLDKKSVTNTYIASLSCTDLLCGVSGIMVFVSSIIRDAFPEANQNCFIWILAGLITFLFCNSLANTLLISCDRLLATVWPIWYKTTITHAKSRVAVLAMWLTVFAITNIPLVISATRLDTSQSVLKIVTMSRMQPGKYSEYVIGPVIVVLMLANCIVYAVVFIAFKKSAHRIQPSLQGQRRSRRMTRTILWVVVGTLVCWIPTVFFFVLPPKVDFGFRAQAGRAGFGLLIVPSCMDNFMYAFRHNEYREAYLNLLFRRRSPVETKVETSKAKNTLTLKSMRVGNL